MTEPVAGPEITNARQPGCLPEPLDAAAQGQHRVARRLARLALRGRLLSIKQLWRV
jgi:hypothetical protein